MKVKSEKGEIQIYPKETESEIKKYKLNCLTVELFKAVEQKQYLNRLVVGV